MQILTLVLGGGGTISGIVALIANRRLSAAQAAQAEEQVKTIAAQADGAVTDYAGKIIEQTDKIIAQSDKRIEQEIEHRDRVVKDLNRAIEERDAAYVEIKERRNAERALRDEKGKLKEEITALLVEKASKEPKVCQKPGCRSREPQSGY